MMDKAIKQMDKAIEMLDKAAEYRVLITGFWS
jgi:hypothetical protein